MPSFPVPYAVGITLQSEVRVEGKWQSQSQNTKEEKSSAHEV
jgi:hypothetical protein